MGLLEFIINMVDKVIRWFKVKLAEIYSEKMLKEFQLKPTDEIFRQKWIHMQGIILTKGKMKWNWKKVNGK